jgi:hypothetical protein
VKRETGESSGVARHNCKISAPVFIIAFIGRRHKYANVINTLYLRGSIPDGVLGIFE